MDDTGAGSWGSEHGLAEFFGDVPEWLPVLIGEVVILSGLLEARLEMLAATLSMRGQSAAAGRMPEDSIRTCTQALDRLEEDGVADVTDARQLLLDAQNVVRQRNEVVHAVWRPSSRGQVKAARHVRAKRRSSDAEWLDWDDWTRERLQGLAADLGDVLRRMRPVIGIASSWMIQQRARRSALFRAIDPK